MTAFDPASSSWPDKPEMIMQFWQPGFHAVPDKADKRLLFRVAPSCTFHSVEIRIVILHYSDTIEG